MKVRLLLVGSEDWHSARIMTFRAVGTNAWDNALPLPKAFTPREMA
jgi:hypothetical protein